MSNKNTHSLIKSLGKGQYKYSEKKNQLKAYVHQSDYIESAEQRNVCAMFGTPYLAEVFRAEYRKRFYDYLYENVTTVANVSKHTKIPHKYLCCLLYTSDAADE